jgi:hypothetical protein
MNPHASFTTNINGPIDKVKVIKGVSAGLGGVTGMKSKMNAGHGLRIGNPAKGHVGVNTH